MAFCADPSLSLTTRGEEYSVIMTTCHRSNTDQKRFRARWFGLLLLTVSAGLTGCSRSDSLPKLQVYEVKGKVVLADGKPLPSGLVSFVPIGDLSITPSAEIASDGTFSLVTGGSGEGAPIGDYKVRIEAPGLQANPKSKKSLFPFKYTDEDSSGLVVTVRAQSNQLDPFRLK
jgi:hypothetical protein